MKTKIPVLVSVLGLALLAGLSIAATSTPSVPPRSAEDGPRKEFRARMAEKLGLTAEQQKKIDELRARQRAELQALLTPEQQKQAAEMREKAGERLHRFAQARPPGSRGNDRGPALRPPPPGGPLAIVAMGERIKDHLAEKLQLTDEQRDKLEHLGRVYRAQQREFAKKHHEEMRAVLTPEQQKKAGEMKQHFNRRAGAPGGLHPPLASMDDEPAGPMMAGLDSDLGELPPLPDTN